MSAIRGFGKWPRWLVALFVAGLLVTITSAQEEAPEVQVSPEQAAAYRSLSSQITSQGLLSHIQYLSDLESRVAGYPGSERAAAYVLQQFRQIGLSDIQVEKFKVATPVVENSSLEIAGKTIRVYPLWPNGVRTSQVAEAGLECPLIYGEMGDLADFNGKRVAGSAVLLEFNCGSQWLNAPRLGAKAVIFIEPIQSIRGEGEAKFLGIPLDIPRFWIKRAEGQALRSMLEANPNVEARIRCRMRWEQKTVSNIIGKIEGTDPELKQEVVYLESYYDSMSIVPELSPGAENACGIAALIELAKVLKKHPPKRTVILLAVGAHFQALEGIRDFFARRMEALDKGTPHDGPAKFLGLIPYTKTYREREKINLFVGLDFSSKTSRVGVFYKGMFYDQRQDIQRNFSDLARVLRENSEKIGQVLGRDPEESFADGVNPIAGKPWQTFLPGKMAFDHEAFTLGGGRGIGFVTTDDSRPLVDTPFDRVEEVDLGNVTRQVKFVACLLSDILADPEMPVDTDPRFSRMALTAGFAQVVGRAVQFDARQGMIPRKVIPGSIAVLRCGTALAYTTGVGTYRKTTFMGVRGEFMQLVDENGEFNFEGVPFVNSGGGAGRPVFAEAYHLNDDDGRIDFAPDLGASGAKTFRTELKMTLGSKRCIVVMFRCVPIDIYDAVDPQNLATLSGIYVYDAITDAEPRSYGFALARAEPWISRIEDVVIIFAHKPEEGGPSSPVKVTMNLGPAARRLVLLNASLKNPTGIGFQAEKKMTIPNTPLQVAQDLWYLDDLRIRKLGKYRIVNKSLNDLHAKTRELIKEAQKALKARDYQGYAAFARAAWGYEARAYPEVQATTDDVVKGVLFYLVLMLPFAFFVERLVFACPNLKWQIIATFLIFIAVFVVFRFIHPAFDITMNPLIILLAFILLTLSILVISLISTRFEAQLKALQTKMGGVHRADIGRMAVAAAAFALGISNMRRRRARTILTCVTLVLLTFTVLSFTSVVSGMKFNERGSPGTPRYNGIMIRDATWEPLEESAYRVLDDEFGTTNAVAPRAWFFTSEWNQQSFIEISSPKSDQPFNARAVVGLATSEARVTRPQEALAAGQWLRPGQERDCIITDAMAEQLAITPADLGKIKVQLVGLDFLPVGIMDTDKFRKITDLDREILTPIDYIEMQKLQRQGEQTGETGFQEYVHLSPDQIVIIPFPIAVDLGARIESVAVDLQEAEKVRTVLQELMPRLGFNLYAGIGDRIYRWSSLAATSISGLGDLLVPILIAALIVLNTMLGSVYERVREIGIFSSVGLAPGHIATLFMAEAFVYGILGAILGYLVGQGAAKIITIFDLLPGLYLNFSSLSAVASTGIVIGVVLLSTLYPARKASEVATPAIERRWSLPDPVGDRWEIEMPFAVTGEQAVALNKFLTEWFAAYEEYSVGDFVTQDVGFQEVDGEFGTGYSITLMAWLAPFDLGVSQTVELGTIPTDMEDVYEIRLILGRKSGEVSSWKRVNRRFLNTMRKQFLIWRTLATEERERYLATPTGS